MRGGLLMLGRLLEGEEGLGHDHLEEIGEIVEMHQHPPLLLELRYRGDHFPGHAPEQRCLPRDDFESSAVIRPAVAAGHEHHEGDPLSFLEGLDERFEVPEHLEELQRGGGQRGLGDDGRGRDERERVVGDLAPDERPALLDLLFDPVLLYLFLLALGHFPSFLSSFCPHWGGTGWDYVVLLLHAIF